MPWKDVDPSVLAATAHVPTMLAEGEQRLYHWITAHWATGNGAIVDLGCFAGGSTARLAEGHRVAGLHSTIHAYDRFEADETAKKLHLYPAGIPHFSGNNILPLASRFLDPWLDHIELHPGLIQDQTWSFGAIEALIMDASKTKKTCDLMAEMFFPHLIPGHSLVVQQDYLYWAQPWIAVQMQRMSEWFTPVAYAPNDTVVFRCDKAIDDEALEVGRVSDLSDDAFVAALYATRGQMRKFGLAKRVNTVLEAARANPGISLTWEMKRPA